MSGPERGEAAPSKAGRKGTKAGGFSGPSIRTHTEYISQRMPQQANKILELAWEKRELANFPLGLYQGSWIALTNALVTALQLVTTSITTLSMWAAASPSITY